MPWSAASSSIIPRCCRVIRRLQQVRPVRDAEPAYAEIDMPGDVNRELKRLYARVSELEADRASLLEQSALWRRTSEANAARGKELEAENARLREALEEIEATYRLIDGCKIETRAVVYLHKIQMIFRSALGKPLSMLNDAPVQP